MNKIWIAILTLVVSGCAVFDGGQIPKTELAPYSGESQSPYTVSYSTTAKGGFGSAKQLPESAQSVIEGEFLSVLEASEYFQRISKKDPQADIDVDVEVTNYGNPAAMIPAFITGFSLYTIPSWATDNYRVTANVSRTDGLNKKYLLEDSATLVQWLPMIFVFPAKNFSVVPEIRKNMYRKLLSNMSEDGFFTAPIELSKATQ